MGEVIRGEFFEGGCQRFRCTGGFGGVGIGFKLVFARPCVGEDGDEFGCGF